MFWTKSYNKTNHVSAVNMTIKELAYNIESVKKDQPPSRFSDSDPSPLFREAYEKYYQKKNQNNWNGDILEVNYLKDLLKSVKSMFQIKKKIDKALDIIDSSGEL